MSSIIDTPRIQAAFTQGVSAPISSEACPTPDQLWRALDPDEPFSAERYEVLNHCARCPSCAQDLKITQTLIEHAKALQTQTAPAASIQSDIEFAQPRWPKLVNKEPAANSNAQKHWLRRNSVLCAVGAIAATLALVFLPKKQDSEATYRGQAKKGDLRTKDATPQAPAQVQGYRYQARHFSWPKVPRALRYELLLFNAGFELVCEHPAGGKTRLKLPQNACPRFDARRPFYWKVRAIMPNAKKRESSFVSQSPTPPRP